MIGGAARMSRWPVQRGRDRRGGGGGRGACLIPVQWLSNVSWSFKNLNCWTNANEASELHTMSLGPDAV